MGLEIAAATDVIGLVLAEGFVGIPDTPPDISLVQFKLSGSKPFRIVRPTETLLDLAPLVWQIVEKGTLGQQTQRIKADLDHLLSEVDKRLAGLIPAQFSWRAAQ